MTQFSQNVSFSQQVCSQCKNCSRCLSLEEDLDIGVRKILKKLFKFICDLAFPSDKVASTHNNNYVKQFSEDDQKISLNGKNIDNNIIAPPKLDPLLEDEEVKKD